MKVTYPRTILIEVPGERPARYTDPYKAAEHWARAKEQEWINKNKDEVKYKASYGHGRYHRTFTINTLYDEARVRYRRLKRRALRIFRRIMNEG